MKISELKNAPKWLIEANTENADVEMDDGIVVWRGGDWRGGVWRGGDWRGGDWWGGDWRGGVWRGGVWRGGDWRGGVWRGGVWRGEKCKNNLLNVLGLKWPITISDTRMQIGCELHSFTDWEFFDDARIVQMDRGALKFWNNNKVALMALCEIHEARK